MLHLHNKTIIVTGASSGIGRAVAITLAQSGARVILVARRFDRLNRVARECHSIGADAKIFLADLSSEDCVLSVCSEIMSQECVIHGIVNSAGCARFGSLDSARLADFSYMFALNVVAPAIIIREALPYLYSAKGSVVNISSIAGTLAMPHRSFYAATKAALNSLTRSLARELAPAVRVNAILPGPIDTPIFDTLNISDEELSRLRADLLESTPMHRFGSALEVANWVTYLMDDRNSWVTGTLFSIDGGRSC